MSEKLNARSEATRARETLSRLLAIRDHSAKELKEKLSRKYSPAATLQALAWAEQHELIKASDLLSNQLKQQLDRQLKSHRQIGAKLIKKGLPSQKENRETELEKIRKLLARKMKSGRRFSYEEKVKAYRYLKYRGFSDALIRVALNEAQGQAQTDGFSEDNHE